jgi:lysozyme
MQLRIGSKGQEVIRLQKALNAMTTSSQLLKIDGDFGLKTQKAVQEYQQYNKLFSNGIVDRITQKLLGIEIFRGIDVSVYQGDIDWAKINDVHFVFVKASEGKSFRDPTLKANYTGAKSRGIPFGVYHFANYRSTYGVELENFLKAISKIGKMELPPVLDVEDPNHKLLPKQVLDWTLAWLASVEGQLGRKPIIYTGSGYFNKYLNGGKGLEGYPLWIAHYGVMQPSIPKIWKEWDIWQWSGQEHIAGIAEENHVDMNWIAPGSLKGLMAG